METNLSKELNNQGVESFIKGDSEKAKGLYFQALEENPENTTTLNNLGLLYHQLKDFDQAIDYFRKAISIEEKPVFYLNSGNSFAMKGELDRAKENYFLALKIDPNYANAWVSLAKLKTHQNEIQDAIQYWEKAIQSNPKEEFYLGLSKVLMLNQEFEKALEILATLNSSAEVWFQIGKCEYHLRNHGLAENAYKKALAKNPDNLEIRRHFSLNYITSGQIEKGLEQYDLILKIYPENYQIMTEKGVILCSISEFVEAEKWLKNALELNSEYPKARHYLNLIHTTVRKP
ncbi:tetratricopeptide repeat protein [Algoriphagus zhangzhouensis]|uniref:Tetratricopeptide repeat-containing protein n=1 Tax=Algoriphagus zhangzhouensis TaxID=1073327 RepID=A0A1M7ZBK6_9BACT|nr:tetratricopeptide repeat protein [Algoriphagus zhangzhouensis]TDY46811.1 tetratricopeptide repeat protein [Algoriphagus zhangzhouensis]SHO62230.1 Tetratricopeptide repeat-containing protein [Algoriphagus zhangzhouensis]